MRALLPLGLALTALLSGCQSDLTFDNADPVLSRVGPAFCDGDDLVVHYTVFDLEGDPVSLELWSSIPGDTPVAVDTGELLLDVPTREGVASEEVIRVGQATACGQPHEVELRLVGQDTGLRAQIR